MEHTEQDDNARTTRTSSRAFPFPIRKEVAMDGITVRTLAGGRGLTLMHREPYDQLGRNYARILQHANERKLTLALPTRGVYVKGPGLIFKGNPKNDLTEIQFPFGSLLVLKARGNTPERLHAHTPVTLQRTPTAR